MKAIFIAVNPENIFTNSTCQTQEDCKKYDPDNNGDRVSCDTANKPSGKCFCKESDSYHMSNGKCEFLPGIGEHCSKKTKKCLKRNSTCVISLNMHKCLCNQNTHHVRLNNIEYCAEIITNFIDPMCTECEKNSGKCFDINGDRKMDGCICPASKSGKNCQITHGN